MSAAARLCVRCHQPLGKGLFCQYDATFVLDPEGTVLMASRRQRLLDWLVNHLIVIFTVGIGWIIWWFIVAPRGQDPGKAVVGIRVIRTNGDAVATGGMFERLLAATAFVFVPCLLGVLLDGLWILRDRDAQTLHDKLVKTVVVRAKGSEKIVETGGLAALPTGAVPPPGRRSS